MALKQTLSSIGATVVIGVSAIAPATLILTHPLPTMAQVSITGQGTFSLSGRPDRKITSVSVTNESGNRATLALRLENGNLMRFGGIWQGGNRQVFRIQNSGNADAKGRVNFTYVRGSISSISGSGTLDNQPFSFNFMRGGDSGQNNGSTQPMTLTQAGRGIFTLQGRPNRRITNATVTIKRDGSAELAFRLIDGNLMRFGGQLARKDAYSLTIRINNSGMADARGTANVDYGANNSIKNILADGKLDGQSFSVNFSR